jgi:hypothetical protein
LNADPREPSSSNSQLTASYYIAHRHTEGRVAMGAESGTAAKDGLRSYYRTKIEEYEIAVRDKTQNLRRLEAQRNELNHKGARRAHARDAQRSARRAQIWAVSAPRPASRARARPGFPTPRGPARVSGNAPRATASPSPTGGVASRLGLPRLARFPHV